MRLHLIIQRNGLPTTQILWTVPQLPTPHPHTTTNALPLPTADNIASSGSSNSSNHTPHNSNTSLVATLSGNVGGGAGTTISQFLEQVNEVVPLESEDWGLEDYAVEVGGFECLHFAELGGAQGVLREGDVVW